MMLEDLIPDTATDVKDQPGEAEAIGATPKNNKEEDAVVDSMLGFRTLDPDQESRHNHGSNALSSDRHHRVEETPGFKRTTPSHLIEDRESMQSSLLRTSQDGASAFNGMQTTTQSLLLASNGSVRKSDQYKRKSSQSSSAR